MIFYHVLSEAIAYQGKPYDLDNTLINFQYLEKPVFSGFGVTE